jgi:hypothetical protein
MVSLGKKVLLAQRKGDSYPEGADSASHRKVSRLLPDNNNDKRAKGDISKLFRKYLSNVPGKHKVKGLQKITILNTVYIYTHTHTHTHRKC